MIWVIVRNGGYEGKSAPIQAAKTGEEARALLSVMDTVAMGSLEIYAVPVWPEAQTVPWHSIEAVK